MKQIRTNAISEAIVNSRSLINVLYGNIGDISTDRTPFREFLSSICKKHYEFVETVDAVHLSCENDVDVYDKYRARDEMILNLSAMKQRMKESSSFCLIVDLSCAPDGHEKECFLRGVFKLVDDIGSNRLIIICRKEDLDYLSVAESAIEVFEIEKPTCEDIFKFITTNYPEVSSKNAKTLSKAFSEKYLREVDGYSREITASAYDSVKLDELISAVKPNSKSNEITLNDIAGLAEAKKRAKDFMRRIVNAAKIKQMMKTKLNANQMLLYGLPGTGKSIFCEAMANSMNATLMIYCVADMLSMYYGESEKRISEIFQRANEHDGIVVLVLEEIDSLASSRTGGDETSTRVANQLLYEMNNLAPNVILVASSNLPWQIDGGFLRSGRFSEKIYIPLPDFEARSEMLRIKLNDSSHIDVADIANRCEGFNGADMELLCLRAVMSAIDRGSPHVENSDFEGALLETKSSVMPLEAKRMKEWVQKSFW